MISSFRNFAKTKFAGLLVFIMIIPFVFWGMGSMFSSGNSNNIAKINNTNVSTKEFIDFINNSNIPQKTIRENLKNDIIEELLGNLVSKNLLDLEIKDFQIEISENTLLKKIKTNKNFLDKDGLFQRTKYEKFLLENNQSAAGFELRLKNRELQKNLFDYIGAGTVSPNFLTIKSYKEENRKVTLDYVNLDIFYDRKEDITNEDLQKFLSDNEDQLKIELINFRYVVINPKNLIGIDDFNQTFFDKIDKIEIDISNDVQFENIVSELNIKPIEINNFKFSSNKNEIEKKIFELRNTEQDIFEDKNNFILYNIDKITQNKPNLNDIETKEEILTLVLEKNKFDYNRSLFEKIQNKKFAENDFIKLAGNNMKTITLNSIKDNNKFEIDAVKVIYSLPINKMTLINDEKNNIYLAKIRSFKDKKIDFKSNEYKDYLIKQNSLNKNSILKSYDLFLNDKYNVSLNQQTIERVKNFFR